MDREILFRGKSLKTGKWTQGYLFCCWGRAYIAWGMVNNNADMVEVGHENVCQYTGLTDKNGTKIFEGDIVKTNNNRLCKVVWFSSPKYQGWDLVPIETKNSAPAEWKLWEELEVVENIFDNPGLLKQ